MALTVSLLGSNYSIPEPGDTGYDQQVTNYLKNLATAFPQLSGGTYSLTAELDFGASFGLKVLYYKTRTANPSGTGIVRLAAADTVSWRNAANSADLALAKDAGNNLTFAANNITGLPMMGANSIAGQSIPTGATETIVIFGTVERDSDSAYNSGTGRFTVPAGKGGDYEIGAAMAYNTAPTGTCTCSIYKNAVLLKQAAFIAPGAGQTISVSAPAVTLAAGDIIDIRTKHGNGGSQSLSTTRELNYFALKRIPT